jgi:MFS transporter, ACS family, tartrate transporter
MTSQLERQTLRKISWRIVPFIMLLYFISFIDRVNIGFASLTMNKDLGFSSAVFGFGAGIFFLGYFLFEVPSNIILDRVGARLWIAHVMVTWGPHFGGLRIHPGRDELLRTSLFVGGCRSWIFSGHHSVSELLVSGATEGAGRILLYGGSAHFNGAWLAAIQRVA